MSSYSAFGRRGRIVFFFGEAGVRQLDEGKENEVARGGILFYETKHLKPKVSG